MERPTFREASQVWKRIVVVLEVCRYKSLSHGIYQWKHFYTFTHHVLCCRGSHDQLASDKMAQYGWTEEDELFLNSY